MTIFYHHFDFCNVGHQKDILVKKRNFGQKTKFWSQNEILGKKIILAKNQIFRQEPKFW